MRKLSIFFGVVAVCLACAREDGRAAPRPAPAAQERAAAPEPGTSQGVLQGKLPGFPLDEIPPFVREELVAAAQDEFVYDGSPSTLAGCLVDDLPCKRHAIRGLTLIANELAGGTGRAQALAAYNRYYGAFAPEKRASLDVSSAPCKGPPDARITVTEFADFQCGHCALARLMFEELLRKRDDVRVCFKHFPLPSHPHAHSAAQAAVFAHRHGKFWEVHDALFQDQARISTETIKEIVGKAGLDPKQMVQLVAGDELSSVVDRDRAEGDRLGIQGTPSIFVNGRPLGMGLSLDMLLFAIEDEIEWTKGGGKWTAG